MKPRIPALLFVSLAGCSIALPPVCCPAPAGPTPGSGTLRARAAEFQRIVDTKLRPHWPYDALVNLQFTDASMTSVAAYNDPNDSAIWTGVYTAAQAYRYAAAKTDEEKNEALAAVRKAVYALHKLAEAPQSPGVLARVASPNCEVLAENCNCSAKTQTPPCYVTDGVYWLGNTSRDQYTGWFYGMATAWRLVPDPEIRRWIAGDVRTIITAIHDWNYVLHGPNGEPNSGTAGQVHHQMRLSWFLTAATILDEPKYWAWYREQTQFIDLAEADLEDLANWTNIYFDYYGFNLGYLNGFNMVILEHDPKLKALYLQMLENELYRYVKNSGNAFFDYMTMAASDRKSAQTIEQDRASLASFPGPPSVWSCVSPPHRPLGSRSVRFYWLNRLLSPLVKMEAFPQSKTPYPLDQRCSVNFLWQASPYRESCCCDCPASAGSCPVSTYAKAYCGSAASSQSGYLVYPGADYLVAYWMGRYYGFLDDDA